MPDHAKKDYGATQMSTARAVRIDELIRQGIAEGKKFTAEDMIEIQLDTVDVFARRMVSTVVKLAGSMKSALSKDQQVDMELALAHYRDWEGSFAED